MTKLTDTIRAALAKKKGIHHLENDGTVAVDAKAKKAKTTPPGGKKPATRSAGRGR